MQAFSTFVGSQPWNVPFVFAYKGKYIVQVTKSTEGSAHVNAYYYVDNSQNLVDHDFEAGVPAAGQLTIEKTSHVTPGSTAAFQTELTAFLQSLGLNNLAVYGGRAFNWYDAIAAYYEDDLHAVPYGNEAWISLVMDGELGNSKVMSFNGYVVKITKHSAVEIDVDVLCCTEPVEGSAETKHFNVGTEEQGYVISDIVCRESEDIFDSVVTPIEDMLSDQTDYSINAWHGVTSGFDIYDNIPYTDY